MIRRRGFGTIFQALMITILAAFLPGCSPEAPEKVTILFLCPHNASKSVMAAAHFQRIADERGLAVRAITAGTHPGERVDPRVIDLLRENDIVVEEHAPRRVTPEQMDGAYRVISLGCDPADLPASDAQLTRWDDVPPPSQDLRAAHDDIVLRVEQLVAELSQ